MEKSDRLRELFRMQKALNERISGYAVKHENDNKHI